MLGRRFDRVPGRPRDRHPGVVLEVGPVESGKLAEIREVEHAVQRVDELVRDA